MLRPVLPVLLALPLASIVAPAMGAGTLTATSDNRSGSIFATNGSGDPEQSSYNVDPSNAFDPAVFNECVNDSPSKACLNTSSAFLGLAGGNVVTGFSIDSVLTAMKTSASANQAKSEENLLLGFNVTGASAADPYKVRVQGGRTGSVGTFSVKVKNGANATIYSAPATGTFDVTLDLVNGDYKLEIAASIIATGTSIGGTYDYSVDFTKVVPPAGCGVPGAGSCTVSKSTPFCDDAACCTLVCSFDPFCCNTAWDGACASEASASCYPEFIAGPIIDPISGRTHRLTSTGAWSVTNALAATTNENLVTIRDARENEWIRANLLNNVPGFLPAEAWIGLNDVAAEGAYVWDSGIPSAFTAWAPGEPNNNAGGEDFTAMKPANGRWNDLPTSSPRRAVTEFSRPNCGSGGSCFSTHGPGCDDEACCNVICEFDSFCCNNSWDSLCVGEAEIYCTTAVAAGPFINPKTKHKYYVTTSGPWSTAQALAMEMGGYLGIPNDAAENEWIRLNLANAAVGPTQLWLGAHDQLVENSFQTVLGPVVSYTNWANGEPNNSFNEDFVLLSSPDTGKWNDVPNAITVRAVIEVPCAGDFNQDGKVDGGDLGVLLGAWSTASADLTLDGVTDGADLGVLLGGWGNCATSNCCSSHGTPSCDQPACTTCVCDLDPFCCNNSWDSICVGEASEECDAACQCGA